ncbi:alpha/beta hydrolase [Pinibacter aurantiacus]|uniref:Alpha/beta hydrolase n=1 Tax=Pinibacter aurantiacus TaxID=2851599 RepID=A0A9E2W8H9_9BACT|nr:alpha/beta hydrolase [Pinibacter aurantiacus]MBV4358217.1 alpha/beta hydrolase [Pinibacter aurantiacus]
MINKKWTFKKIIGVIWITGGLILFTWLFYSYQAHGVSKSFLQNSEQTQVQESSDFYLFTPTATYKQVLFFYPGAMVDPKAYVPLCRRIADNNIKVYLIKMPFRLASKGYNKPKELLLLADTTKTYVLAGHSEGAKMAAQFIYENPNLIDRLILIGSSHPRDISLSNSKISVIKIYGSNDGVAKTSSIMRNKANLPPSTKFISIEGANHSQFGYYGFQLGDHVANISREQQQAATLKYMVEFIKKEN